MNIFESAINVIKNDLATLVKDTEQSIVLNKNLNFNDFHKLQGQHGAMSFMINMIESALLWIANNQDATSYPSSLIDKKTVTDDQGNQNVVHVVSIDNSAQSASSN